jgi:hypothetical protein
VWQPIFCDHAGAADVVKLTDERYPRDTTRGELLPARSQMTAEGKPVPPAQLANLPACGAFDGDFVTATSKYVVPWAAVWKDEKVSPTEIRYSYGSPTERSPVKRAAVRSAFKYTVHSSSMCS